MRRKAHIKQKNNFWQNPYFWLIAICLMIMNGETIFRFFGLLKSASSNNNFNHTFEESPSHALITKNSLFVPAIPETPQTIFIQLIRNYFEETQTITDQFSPHENLSLYYQLKKIIQITYLGDMLYLLINDTTLIENNPIWETFENFVSSLHADLNQLKDSMAAKIQSEKSLSESLKKLVKKELYKFFDLTFETKNEVRALYVQAACDFAFRDGTRENSVDVLMKTLIIKIRQLAPEFPAPQQFTSSYLHSSTYSRIAKRYFDSLSADAYVTTQTMKAR